MLRELKTETIELENGQIETTISNDAGEVNKITLTPIGTVSTKQLAEEAQAAIKSSGIPDRGVPFAILKTIDSYINNERLFKFYAPKQAKYHIDPNYIDLHRSKNYYMQDFNFIHYVQGLGKECPILDELRKLQSAHNSIAISEWVQHEEWKTGKLVREIPVKALNMIQKKLLTSLPTVKHYKSNDNNSLILASPTRFLTLLMKYLSATDADLFSDTFRLLSTNIYNKKSKALIRSCLGNVAKVKIFDQDSQKAVVIPVIDDNNRCLSRATFNMIRKLSFLKYTALIQNRVNTKSFLYHKFLKQDEESARILAERIISESHLIYPNSRTELNEKYPYLFIIDKSNKLYVDICNILEDAEDNITEYMEQARIYYLRGRLSLLTEAISKGYCNPDILVVKDGTTCENEEYNITDRNAVILRVFYNMAKDNIDDLSSDHIFDQILDRAKMVDDMLISDPNLNTNLFYNNIQLHQIHIVGRNKAHVLDVNYYAQERTPLTESETGKWHDSASFITQSVEDLIHIIYDPRNNEPQSSATKTSNGIRGFDY